jgi:hypothetical protein
MPQPSIAAGLLLLFLISGQFCVAGPLSPGLVDTFKARALAKTYHKQQRALDRPSLRDHRRIKRQGQIRLAVTKDATNVTVIDPPQIVRPRVKLETAKPVERKDDGGMGSMENSDGTVPPRHRGRMNRDIKAMIEADMESGDVDDGAVEFMISEMEKDMLKVIPMAGAPQYGAITFTDGKIDLEPGSSGEGSTSEDSPSISSPQPSANSASPLTRRDGPLVAASTWEGQPSPYRPKKPYEPSKHPKSEDYADIISKSMWFYQVQRRWLKQHWTYLTYS